MINKENKYLLPVLVLSTVISTGFAIYFGYRLQQKNAILKANENIVNYSSFKKQQQIVNTIDSLILNKNYKAAKKRIAATDSKDIPDFSYQIKVREHLLKNLVTTNQRTSNISHKTSQQTSNSTSSQPKTIIIKDSLYKELEKAKSEISSLQKNSKPASYNEHLTFSTSKGTSLHYVGQVDKNKANGYGIALLETGSRYEGNWKNNMRHGQGKFYWNDGEHYEGTYHKDKREGIGTYYWTNGEKYVGEWKNDQRNGHGEFFNKKGKLKASGTWKNDKLVEEEK